MRIRIRTKIKGDNMKELILPKDYKSELNLHDTQLAIKTVKDFFQALLAQRLNLTRVSAPLFVDPATGLNSMYSADWTFNNIILILQPSKKT